MSADWPMKYEEANWRIKISRTSFIEISIKGLDNQRQSCPANDVVRAGSILKDLGLAVRRLECKWAFDLAVAAGSKRNAATTVDHFSKSGDIVIKVEKSTC